MRPIQAILLDFDGTLADTLGDIHFSFSFALQAFGLPPVSTQQLGPVLGQGASTALAPLLGLGSVDGARLRELVGLFLQHYTQNMMRTTRVRPGGLEVLHRFKGIPRIVVTNKPVQSAKEMLVALNLAPHLEAVYGGDSFDRKKPDPFPLLEALRPYGIPPARAVMVGDSPMDVVAGKRAGLQTCAVLGGFCTEHQLREVEPDHVLAGLGELLELYRPEPSGEPSPDVGA